MLPPNFPTYAPQQSLNHFNGGQQQQPAPPSQINNYKTGQPPQQHFPAAPPQFPLPGQPQAVNNPNTQWQNHRLMPMVAPPAPSLQNPVAPATIAQNYNATNHVHYQPGGRQPMPIPPMQTGPPAPSIPVSAQNPQNFNATNNVQHQPVQPPRQPIPSQSMQAGPPLPPPVQNFNNSYAGPTGNAMQSTNFQPPVPNMPSQHQHQPQYQSQQMPHPQQYQDNNQAFTSPPQPNMYYNNQPARYLDLMQERGLLSHAMDDNGICLPESVCNPEVHCAPSVFRCTMSAIPETTELVNKCRLPLGLTLHPFRDLKNLTVIQTNIVRCRYCRTYINPYVYLPDNRHWKCNLCYRSNDLPEEFTWDPETKSFGDPCRRPELKNATIEYIAPSEYMLRSPQPTLYLFIFDVSSTAVDCGYLHNFSEQLLIDLDQMPGDERTLIGFIGVDAALHFFQFIDPSSAPKHLVAYDIEEPFAPVNFGLVIELHKYKESIRHFIQTLPTLYESNSNSSNCLGSALTIARDLISDIGGRITVLLASNPSVGPGALNSGAVTANSRETSKLTVGPSTDFYKRLALECTGKQISVDLFVMGERHADIATLSEIAKFSSGSVYHFPSYHFIREQTEVKRFQKFLNRYLTRKLGLEAVLRIRCSKGLSLHTFHGNFFVRSTDLLAMANVNPDAAIGVQIQLEESLSQQHTVCFQAALLYTSTRGDRRIRVHTLCLPVVNDFSRIFNYFDIKATVSLLSKMAAERAMTGADLQDCREALINAATDALSAYNRSVGQRPTSILVPVDGQLKFLAIFILGLLKSRAFSSSGLQQSVDQRVAAMLLFKNAPIEVIMLEVCPALYSLENIGQSEDLPQRLPLSYERVSRDGVYLLDTGSYLYMYVCGSAKPLVLEGFFGVNSFAKVDEDESLKQLENPLSAHLHSFLRHLQSMRGSGMFAPVLILRDDSVRRELFTRRLVEDRTEAAHSYVEFLQHLRREISSE